METVLITGGSGIIGMRLSEILETKGYSVHHLSRSVSGKESYITYKWDLASKYIDPNALENVDHIIHLSGENVGGGRWTKARKKNILKSRIDTAKLLFTQLKGRRLKSFISASGISYYGSKSTANIYKESDESGEDFLAEVCVGWEYAAEAFKDFADRVVCIRTGVVLSPKGGALDKMVTPIKWNFGSPLGSGNQYMAWLHLEDICGIYLHSLQNEQINGVYNAVASEHATNAEFTKKIAKVIGKKLWAPKVPAFLIRLLFGEMAIIILEGSRIDNQKIKDTGYQFQFDRLEPALKDILT